jgi:hypothetical protein
MTSRELAEEVSGSELFRAVFPCYHDAERAKQEGLW